MEENEQTLGREGRQLLAGGTMGEETKQMEVDVVGEEKKDEKQALGETQQEEEIKEDAKTLDEGRNSADGETC